MPPQDDTKAYEPVECPKCGNSIPAHVKYCPHCGHPLAERAGTYESVLCDKEGILVPAGGKYCPACKRLLALSGHIPRSQLRGMGVVTDRGLQVGKLYDILVDENDRVEAIIVTPLTREALATLPRDKSGNVTILFGAVMWVRNYIAVNERVLAIYS